MLADGLRLCPSRTQQQERHALHGARVPDPEPVVLSWMMSLRRRPRGTSPPKGVARLLASPHAHALAKRATPQSTSSFLNPRKQDICGELRTLDESTECQPAIPSAFTIGIPLGVTLTDARQRTRTCGPHPETRRAAPEHWRTRDSGSVEHI